MNIDSAYLVSSTNYNLDCVHTVTHTHTPLVPLDNRSNIAAIVGGVAGGLVALGIMSLLSGIIIVAMKLSKQGK